MNWKAVLLSECKLLKTKIEKGKFNPRTDTKRIRNLYKQVDKDEKATVLYECQLAIQGAAIALANKGTSRVLNTKLVQYHGQKLISKQAFYNKDYLQWMYQYLYTLFTGRLLTPLGGVRLYFSAAIILIIVFSGLFSLTGLEWTTNSAHNVNFLNKIYFSAVTLTTLGYGDIHPKNEIGQIIAIVEALFGYLVLGLGVFAISNFIIPFRPDPVAIPLDEYTKRLNRKTG